MLKSFRVLLGSAFALLLGFVLVACGDGMGSGSTSTKAMNTMDAIKNRGVLVAGVKNDVPNIALLNPGTKEIEGFEVDIVKMIAKDILGDESKVRLDAVTAKTRGPLLDNGTLDLVVATFTITEERKKTYDFSEPYYEDPVGFLVLKKSRIPNFKGLDGKVVGVSSASSTAKIVKEAADKEGIKVTIREFADYPSLKSALDSGRIDAFSVDKTILSGYFDDNNVLLDDELQPQLYGVATRKSDPEWSEYINNFIVSNKEAIDELAVKWNLKRYKAEEQ